MYSLSPGLFAVAVAVSGRSWPAPPCSAFPPGTGEGRADSDRELYNRKMYCGSISQAGGLGVLCAAYLLWLGRRGSAGPGGARLLRRPARHLPVGRVLLILVQGPAGLDNSLEEDL